MSSANKCLSCQWNRLIATKMSKTNITHFDIDVQTYVNNFFENIDFSEMEKKEINQQKFANAVLKAAKDKNLSLRKLAATSGLEFSQVQRISKGKVNLALSTIIALIEGLEMSPSEFFNYYE